MTPFIGRESELAELKEEFATSRASLVVLSGRRRIGKSRLIDEFASDFTYYKFSGIPPYEGMSAQDQRDLFVKRLVEYFNLISIKGDDWGDLFVLLAKQTKNKCVVILFDEITWMAYNDDSFLSKLKTVWDDYFSKNNKLMLVLCGSVSAWIEDKILSDTGYLGRPTWSIKLSELSLTRCAEFWPQKSQVSAFEKLKLLSVTGGVPRYLELIDPKKTAEQNIQRLCFNKNGPLFREYQFIFSDIYGKRTEKYHMIILRLAKGAASREQISEATGIAQTGDLTEYLRDLELGGFIARDYTWDLKSGKQSKLSMYRLKDNYTRFYVRFIQPNESQIEKGRLQTVSPSSLNGWNTVLGLQFENLIVNNCLLITRALGISDSDVLFDNPYFQRKTARTQAVQIDYMVQTKHDTLYVFEVRFKRHPIGCEIIPEMQDRISKIALPKHISRRPVLIHVNGVTDELLDTNYFSHLIDFSELVG